MHLTLDLEKDGKLPIDDQTSSPDSRETNKPKPKTWPQVKPIVAENATVLVYALMACYLMFLNGTLLVLTKFQN
jgi:hypothetical protein